MRPGEEGWVLGKVRVVVLEVYPDGTAQVEVVPDDVLDLEAHVKKFYVPGMRLRCSLKAIQADEPEAMGSLAG